MNRAMAFEQALPLEKGADDLQVEVQARAATGVMPVQPGVIAQREPLGREGGTQTAFDLGDQRSGFRIHAPCDGSARRIVLQKPPMT